MILRDICRPNPNGLGKDYRLMRSDPAWTEDSGWTSNGFWMMRTNLEPKFISKLKETSKSPDGIVKIIREAENSQMIRLDVDYDHLDISSTPTITLRNANKEYYINAYYISLFDNLNFKIKRRYSPPTEYFATADPGSYKPIIVKSLGTVVGLIMSINK